MSELPPEEKKKIYEEEKEMLEDFTAVNGMSCH